MGERFAVQTLDGSGSFGGYLALPPGGKGPGIVVVQEIFGVNAGIRAMCDDWARAGYVAYAPDLFWRIEPGVDITDKSKEEWAKAFDLFGKFDVDKGVADVEAALRAVKGHVACTGKAGVVGFCLGGLMAYLAATRTDSDASVGYYGVNIDKKLGESHAIAKPLMLHIATEDGFVDGAAQKAMHEGLGGNRHVTLHDYKADHAFARVDGEHRDEACAQLANGRTAAFFAEHLK